MVPETYLRFQLLEALAAGVRGVLFHLSALQSAGGRCYRHGLCLWGYHMGGVRGCRQQGQRVTMELCDLKVRMEMHSGATTCFWASLDSISISETRILWCV